MTEIVMHDGAGSFAFADDTGGVRRTLRVFYFQPTGGTRDRRIVVAMHGLDRKAAEFRDVMQRPAERNGQILLVPEFDLQQFPDNFAYNFGGVRLPSSMTVLPREAWNFGLLDQLFQRVVAVTGSTAKSFGLFGNSAGAQYVLRYLALTEAPAVDRVVASNSGMYMLPDLAADYPTGMAALISTKDSCAATWGAVWSCCWARPTPRGTRVCRAARSPMPRARTGWRGATGTTTIAASSPSASACRLAGSARPCRARVTPVRKSSTADRAC